jgi:hypothetical protein
MKKYLPLSILIILISATTLLAGMGMMGEIAKEKPNGEIAKAIFYGDLIMGQDRVMENAIIQAEGQFLISDPNDDLLLRTSSQIFAITKKSIELNIDGKTKTFQITRKTKFCDRNGNKIKRKEFLPGDRVTISSKLDESFAADIRKRGIYFTGAMSGAPKLRDVACSK